MPAESLEDVARGIGAVVAAPTPVYGIPAAAGEGTERGTSGRAGGAFETPPGREGLRLSGAVPA